MITLRNLIVTVFSGVLQLSILTMLRYVLIRCSMEQRRLPWTTQLLFRTKLLQRVLFISSYQNRIIGSLTKEHREKIACCMIAKRETLYWQFWLQPHPLRLLAQRFLSLKFSSMLMARMIKMTFWKFCWTTKKILQLVLMSGSPSILAKIPLLCKNWRRLLGGLLMKMKTKLRNGQGESTIQHCLTNLVKVVM